MSVVGEGETAEVRRRHLAALAYEVESRGLVWKFAGPDESLLAVHGPRTGRQAMVVATPSGDGWYYLWPGGGMAEVARLAEVADRLHALLG
ncbi:hypothetical protein [Actinomadura darangshiensis]|uniref:hypothetical protein n=1 Tax=Actinomadura darangshiensis TaxID=705336 RepID=UPI001FB7A647|nr:hypothetical protein [Actinomadura darangshiensis]